MRKYVQFLLVVAAFALSVFLRHRLFPGGGSTAVSIAAAPEPTPGSTATAAPTLTPAPVPTTAIETAAPLATSTAIPTATAVPVASPAPTHTPVPTETATVLRLVPTTITGAPRYKDGEYTGKRIYTNYGTMQVRVVIKGNGIEEIVPLSEPRATPTSIGIADELIPKWIAQVLDMQHWDVDRVSGATVTWQAFERAVIYALRQSE